MTAPADFNPDFLPLETDNFVSPDAANDSPADDSLDLEMDLPVAAVEAMDALAAQGPATDDEIEAATASLDFSDIAAESTANASTGTSGAFGSIRRVESPVTGSDAPVGAGTTVLPQGMTEATYVAPVFRATRPAVQAPGNTAPVVPAAPAPLLERGALIASLVADAHGIVVSPGRADRRHTLRSATDITNALATVGMSHLAPRIKSNKAQFGEVMRSLKHSGMVTTAITRKDLQNAGQEWPEDLASRWIVGTLNGSDELGTLGEKELVADLLKSDEIRFTGGSDTLRAKVREAFVTRVGERTFNSTDMLNWFRAILVSEYHAVCWGGFFYIPGNAADTAPVRALVRAVKGLLGRSVAVGDVTSDEGLREGLGEGLLGEIEDIQEAYEIACEKAQEREMAKVRRDKKDLVTDADLELAARRAVVLPEAAGTFVRRLNDAQDKISGYATMLGEDAVIAARALLASLRATIEPLCDSTSAMGANIELS